jgi:hypothetical protein
MPIPGIEFDIFTYDDITGGRWFPNSIFIYRNARGDYVKSKTNQWGYFDKKHQKKKKEGIYRIGFYGDSFVEAKQVSLEQRFFRLIEDKLKGYNVECLGFGTSGFGTLQSYLTSNKWTDFFNLDMVVYVFYENDPGDQIKEIKKSSNIPYPIPAENGFQIDYSFRKKNKWKNKLFYKIGDYLTAHSLVFSTIDSRIRLLRKYGINVKRPKENVFKKKTRTNSIPNENDLPSTWPESLRLKAKKVCATVISHWKDKIASENRNYAVMYIPRDDIFKNDTKNQDSWQTWLEFFCKTQAITFIDSTSNLAEMEFSGKEVFYDHFTKEGHEAFAKAFVEWYMENSVNLTKKY